MTKIHAVIDRQGFPVRPSLTAGQRHDGQAADEWNLIERFFFKLNHFRRVATCYDKLAENSLTTIRLAPTRPWLRAKSPRSNLQTSDLLQFRCPPKPSNFRFH